MSAHRFGQIIEQMKELASEARSLVPPHAQPRADNYWVAQLHMILDNDHGYFGSCGCSMVDTLEEWNDAEESEREAKEAIAVMEFFKNDPSKVYGEFKVHALQTTDHLEVSYEEDNFSGHTTSITSYFNLDDIADAIEEIEEQRLPVKVGDSGYYISILSLLTKGYVNDDLL